MASKQGLGKIDWTDWTWSPIKGKCGYNCEYCYMDGIRKRFHMDETLRLDEKELKWCPREPSMIFVCSQLDMFHPDIPSDWIEAVMDSAHKKQKHIYQWLSKNPSRYGSFEIPSNSWIGATVDGLEFTQENLTNLANISPYFDSVKKFISFEPLIQFPTFDVDADMAWAWDKIDWIIIGADSRKGAAKPPREWANILIDMAREHDVAVWVKDNWPWVEVQPRPKDFPGGAK